MKEKQQTQKSIQVCAHWKGMVDPVVMGTLYATPVRGKEIFSFEYDSAWLKSSSGLTVHNLMLDRSF